MRYLLLVSASVLVVEPPRIISQPQELRDVVEGKSARFSIQATGTEPLNYKWQWKPIEKGSVQKPNEGSYRCVTSNHAGTEISRAAQLSVGKKPMHNMYRHCM